MKFLKPLLRLSKPSAKADPVETVQTPAGLPQTFKPIKRPKKTQKQIDFDKDHVLPQDWEDIEENLQYLAHQTLAGWYSSRCIQNAGSEFEHGDTDRALTYLDLAAKTAAAHFASSQDLRPHPIDHNGRDYPVISQRTNDRVSAAGWQDGVHVAIILRNEPILKSLLEVPEAHMRTDVNPCSEFHYSYARFLTAMYDEHADLGAALIAFNEDLAPDKVPDDAQTYVDRIMSPLAVLYRTIFSPDNDAFNAALYDALAEHNAFWGHADNRFDGTGCVAWPIVAACTVACSSRDKTITVSSDYLPMSLVAGVV
ncbi:MAG: immunity 49 family protein [Pseudomonadota bacterium]